MKKRYFIVPIFGDEYQVTKTRFYVEVVIRWIFYIGMSLALIGLLITTFLSI